MDKYYSVIENAKPFDIIFLFKRVRWYKKLLYKNQVDCIRATTSVLMYHGNGKATRISERGVDEVETLWLISKYRLFLGQCKEEVDYKAMREILSRARREGKFEPTLWERVESFFGKKKGGYLEGAKVSAEYVTLAFQASGVILVPGVRPWDITPLGSNTIRQVDDKEFIT